VGNGYADVRSRPWKPGFVVSPPTSEPTDHPTNTNQLPTNQTPRPLPTNQPTPPLANESKSPTGRGMSLHK
jgi:hypothetical protein